MMEKYTAILKVGLKQELTYKLQFILTRLRNIIQILVFFFLWQSVLVGQDNLFGYTSSSIAVYTFLLIIIRSLVMTTKANDVSGYVSNGELSNYLLKPINFFKYILVKDIPVRLLNLFFSVFEISILFLLLKPNIFVQTNPIQVLFFLITLVIASVVFFLVLMTINAVPFWVPDMGWGAQFLFMMIFVEFLSGAFFPLDVFPTAIQSFLKLTPFPYIVFIPIKTYLGDITLFESLKNISIGLVWCFILVLLMRKTWKAGLKIYEGVGR